MSKRLSDSPCRGASVCQAVTGAAIMLARLLCAVVTCALISCTLFTAVADAVQITEFALPAGSKPAYITRGPDGNMWFTDSGTNEIGRITMSGEVTEFGLGITPKASLAGIAAGPDGNLWFTEREGHKIGRITPAGAITEFSAGLTNNPDIYGITAGPGGDMWFTETFNGHIGKIDPTTGMITEMPVPAGINTTILQGPDGNLWYTSIDKATINQMTPTGTVTTFGPLPESDCETGAKPPYCPYPEGVAVGRDGNLWVGEGRGNAIARITPAGLISEYTDGLTHGARVADLAAGPEGNTWFTELAADQVGRITPAGLITEFNTGLSKAAEPFGIALGPDENLWVTERSGKIARVIPDVPPVVATGAAAGVSSGAATVSGTVRSRGADTHYEFQYGLTTAYGQSSGQQDNGAGDNAQAVSVGLSGLQPGVVYHYRLVASNANGSSYGQDQTFATPLPPPTVTVGSFAIYFHGTTSRHKYLRLSNIVVIGVQRGERVVYVCERCHGSSTHGTLTASGSKVVFATRSLLVSSRSLLRVSVFAANGSRRTRTYGVSVVRAETTFKSEQCFLPGSSSPVACPGASEPVVKHTTGHKGRGKAKHKRHSKPHGQGRHPKPTKHHGATKHKKARHKKAKRNGRAKKPKRKQRKRKGAQSKKKGHH